MDPSASRDVSKPVIMFLLLFGAVMIPLATPVSANPVETQILTFGDGSASVDLNLIANTTDTSTSLALPRNVTVSGASMELAYSGSDASPGQVTFSLDGDSTPEFAGPTLDWVTSAIRPCSARVLPSPPRMQPRSGVLPVVS